MTAAPGSGQRPEGTVGVIAHLSNPTPAEAVELAAAAEDAGADWIGFADAFWWRDVWMVLAEVARATRRIALGPAVTNPYLRHPFHTLSATATLAELCGEDRIFLGLAAGGSELRGATHLSRRDAPERVGDLAALVRRVAAGEPLDLGSGRRLDVALPAVPVLIAGKGDRMLDVAGAAADWALLWAFPGSDVERAAGRVHAAGAANPSGPPKVIWAPLVDHDDTSRAGVERISVYAVVNASRPVRARWGIDEATVREVRALLVAGRAVDALTLVPPAVRHDLVLARPDPADAAASGRALGASGLALPGFSAASVGAHIAWARAVAELL